MSSEQVVLVAAGVVALVALLLALRAQRRASAAEASAAALGERLALLERPVTAPTPSAPSAAPDGDDVAHYLITSIAPDVEEPASAVPVARPIDGRLFADIVARETVVKAASWTHGLRRALSPESRNRIRFAARQEARRSTRERRAEMKQALREFRARERAAVRAATSDPVGEDVA
ncbi:hypothetical protein F4692_003540 [Nocardioides cavernae]|uniref:Uncharacterized protein n=1 Tax=Nocardioides cavernae TaxID=1921566 RepID=A0A7Y9H5S2_9ACTN|nr:hypothetical protein [Nocardioides cavernae]NYE38392.1 hypothetical protein [Nocardioides cavernae]